MRSARRFAISIQRSNTHASGQFNRYADYRCASRLADSIVRGGGFGLLWNVAFGVLGTVLGSFLLGFLGISPAAD